MRFGRWISMGMVAWSLLQQPVMAAVLPAPVVAGVGVGSIRLHMSRAEVLQHLGAPHRVSENWLCYGKKVASPVSPTEYELMVLLDAGGMVQTVRTYSPRYRTALGVVAGCSLARLRGKYRTRLQTLVQTDSLDTLWVKEARGTVLFYVSTVQKRVLALEISI